MIFNSWDKKAFADAEAFFHLEDVNSVQEFLYLPGNNKYRKL